MMQKFVVQLFNQRTFEVIDDCVDGEVFDSEEEANSYVWPFPEVFIEEVTNKPEYKMANYWKRTRG